jgi:hypothetical protein
MLLFVESSVHMKFNSNVQVLEHPSPLNKLPSSQGKPKSIPSPQV